MDVSVGAIAAGWAGKKVLDGVYRVFEGHLRQSSDVRLRREVFDLSDEALARMASEVHQWSSQMEFDLNDAPTRLAECYVPLECYVRPVSELGQEANTRRKFSKYLKAYARPLIILGRPGYGKTTTAKALCAQILEDRSPLPDVFGVPMLVRLREFAPGESLFDHILKKLKVGFCDRQRKDVKLGDVEEQIKQELVFQLFNEKRFAVVIDGFDELRFEVGRQTEMVRSLRSKLISEFRQLCMNCPKAFIFLTSRTADFPYQIEGVEKIEISPLSPEQVRAFVAKQCPSKEAASEISNALLVKQVLGAEMIPLTLTYICFVYRRQRRLYDSRRDIYAKIIELLLESWDERRDVDRMSMYPEFKVSSKKRFLYHLSYGLTLKYGGSSFSDEDLRYKYSAIVNDYEGITESDYRGVFREVEVHTGLFVADGGGYSFSHKTMQEYLFAKYLVDMPTLPANLHTLFDLPDELAMAVSISETPSLYFAYLVLERSVSHLSPAEFLLKFLDRLIHEEVQFGVHPYLALAFLKIFTDVMQSSKEGDEALPGVIKNFYRFLKRDRRVELSMAKLAGHYVIDEVGDAQGYVWLVKRSSPDLDQRYTEPERVAAPYDVYEIFDAARRGGGGEQSQFTF